MTASVQEEAADTTGENRGAKPQSLDLRDALVAAACGGGVLLLYLLTAPRGLWGSDGAEFALASVRLGLTHAPGYPFYVLLGHVAYRLTGDPMWGLTLLSAVSGGLGVAVLYYTARWLRCGRAAAVLAAVYFGVNHAAWHNAIQPEVYATNLPWFGLSLLLILVYREGRQRWALVCSGVVLGLSCGIYLANALVVPAWLYLIVEHKERRVQRSALFLLPVALSGLAMALWAYVRSRTEIPISIQYVPNTVPNVLRYMLAAEFSAVPFTESAHEVAYPSAASAFLLYGQLFTRNWLGVGVIYGLLGCVLAWKTRRRETIALGIIFTILTVYWAPKAYGATLGMALPVAYVFSLWIATAIDAASRWAHGPAQRMLAWGPVMLAVCGLIGFHVVRYQRPPSSHFFAPEEAVATLNAFPRDAVIFTPMREFTLFTYMQQVQDRRHDLTLVESEPRPVIHPEFGLVDDWRPLAQRLAGTRPFVLHVWLVDASGLKEAGEWEFVPLGGDWVSVRAASAAKDNSAT